VKIKTEFEKDINAKELKTKNEWLLGDSSFAVLIVLRTRFIKEGIV